MSRYPQQWVKPTSLVVGGPCTCSPNRYVRYVIPTVPGVVGFISCRANGAGAEALQRHAIPDRTSVWVRMPGVEGVQHAAINALPPEIKQ